MKTLTRGAHSVILERSVPVPALADSTSVKKKLLLRWLRRELDAVVAGEEKVCVDRNFAWERRGMSDTFGLENAGSFYFLLNPIFCVHLS